MTANTQETAENAGLNLPKVLTLRRNTANSPLSLKEKPIKVKNLRDAKKLLSRILVAFQRGELEGREAKDLAYLLSVWVQIVKDADLEERIRLLEAKTGGKEI
ncbi:MAG: hypothetical protein NTZ35_02095 [Ignavibacteriales bacterium]|nr:hypothetical protein [Ignavibacteriales bacterium]